MAKNIKPMAWRMTRCLARAMKTAGAMTRRSLWVVVVMGVARPAAGVPMLMPTAAMVMLRQSRTTHWADRALLRTPTFPRPSSGERRARRARRGASPSSRTRAPRHSAGLRALRGCGLLIRPKRAMGFHTPGRRSLFSPWLRLRVIGLKHDKTGLPNPNPKTPPAVGPWCCRNFIPRRSNSDKNQMGLPGPNPKPTSQPQLGLAVWCGGVAL